MSKNIQQFIILFNFIVSVLLLMDLYLPNTELPLARLESFHATQRYYGYRYRGGYELVKLVELKDGRLYRIGRLPVDAFQSGQNIKIEQSRLFGKVNEIQIYGTKWTTLFVGYVYKEVILFCLVVGLGLGIGSRYWSHPALDIGLLGLFLYLLITFGVYAIVY
jgi:hypothetical protein